ncbi:hypothetical protein H312_03201, partial [Anncaliia algerae PRA339]
PVDLYGCKAIGKNNKLKILIALLLSSQTKDEVTYNAVHKLDERLEGVSLVKIKESTIDNINNSINKVGFHNRKSAYLKEIAEKCYQTGLPNNLQELLDLPGIGYKMALLYMQHAHQKILGISVDTHVHRVSNRLGLVKSKSTEGTRKQLENLFVEDDWAMINSVFVGFGQKICTPVKPKCNECNAQLYCNFYNKW